MGMAIDKHTNHSSEGRDVARFFRFNEVIGSGASGVVTRCQAISTGVNYACKSVAKAKIVCQLDLDDLNSEILSLEVLKTHPNVLKLEGIYEDSMAVHLVTELCKGGDLFERLKQKKYFSERTAAMVTRSVASALAYAHSNGIMHRDLKPENILLTSAESDTDIRVADFGSSTSFTKGQKLNQLIGSTLYIAPSVLRHSYGPEADLWSLGVILYILLSGRPPFLGKTNAEIFQQILNKPLDLNGGRLRHVSTKAKNLLTKLLCRDPEQYISAADVLWDPFITLHCGIFQKFGQAMTVQGDSIERRGSSGNLLIPLQLHSLAQQNSFSGPTESRSVRGKFPSGVKLSGNNTEIMSTNILQGDTNSKKNELNYKHKENHSDKK